MSKIHEVFTSQVEVSCSCEKVFAILTSPSLFPLFLKEILEVRSFKEPLDREGDSYAEARLVMGKIVWSTIFVSSVNAPHRIAYSSSLKVVSATYEYDIEPTTTGAVVVLKAYTQAKNLFGRMLLPMINATIRKQDSRQLNYLQSFIRSQAKESLDD